MSLLDEAKAVSNRGNSPQCSVSKALVAHPDLADEINELLDTPCEIVPHQAAADIFKEHGVEIRASAVSRHRRGLCKCH